MPIERFSDLIRNANPVTQEPTRSMDDAWNDVVAAQGRPDPTFIGKRRRTPFPWTPTRRLVAAAVAVLLIAGISTVVSVRGSSNSPSLTNSIAQAFGVVNADAASAGSFSATPASPHGFNVLTCPSSEVCYLESTNSVDLDAGSGQRGHVVLVLKRLGVLSRSTACSVGLPNWTVPTGNGPVDADDDRRWCHVDESRGRNQPSVG
jgi:hypothetical protein